MLLSPVKEIEKILINLKNEDRACFLKNYFSSDLDVLGISSPKQRKIFNEGFSWSFKTERNQLKIWDKIWKEGKSIEVMNQPLYWLNKIKHKEDLSFRWKVVSKWINKVENWVHSDSLSNYYSLALEQNQKITFPYIKKWNTSNNLWKRRQSLTCLLFYARFRKKTLPSNVILSLISNLLSDEEYFVQKGVGWSIRECWQVYPNETLNFLYKNIKQISSVAFSPATEKISKIDKIKLKEIRKSKKL